MGETIVMLRNSERSTYRRCRQRWVWNYVDRRVPPKSKPALLFGTLVHKAMELRYPPGIRRGPHPAESFIELYEEAIAEDGTFGQWDEDGERMDALELGTAMLHGYVDLYGKEPHLRSLIPEMAFAIDIVDEHGNYVCTLVGQIDGVFRHRKTGKLLIRDYKTAKSIDYNLRPNSGYGEQGMVYWWAATLWLRHQEIIGPDEVINVLEFDWLRKGMPDQRPTNKFGHRLNKPTKDALLAKAEALGIEIPKRGATMDWLTEELVSRKVDVAQLGEPSKLQPPPLFHRTPFVFDHTKLTDVAKRVRMEAEEMALVRAGALPVYKNPTKDCSWDCSFVDVCELHELNGAWRDMLTLEFTKWDPYDAQALLFEKV